MSKVSPRAKKDCPEGKVLNPKTGRCVSPSYLVTQRQQPEISPQKPRRRLVAVEEESLSPLQKITPKRRRLVAVEEETEFERAKENAKIISSAKKTIEKAISKETSTAVAATSQAVRHEEEPNIPLTQRRIRRLVEIDEGKKALEDEAVVQKFLSPTKETAVRRQRVVAAASHPISLITSPPFVVETMPPFSSEEIFPSYELENFIPVYPQQTDPNIQKIVASKKEFADFGAKTGEGIPLRGQLFNHQRLFLRLMRAYDKMLLIADPGTGKTLSFLAVTEYYKKVGVYKKAYILEKGPILLNAVKLQLACKATPKGVYDTDAVNFARTDKARATALTKAMSDFYVFKTYTTFASEFSSQTDEEVIENYSGCIFVIDEAHNLVSDAKSSDRYASILRVLTLARRIKVILATATPMVNSPKELGPLMNFILPPERAFPSDYKFTPHQKVEPDDILNRCRGFVSYVRAETLKAKSKYIGTPVRIEEIENDIEEQDDGAAVAEGDKTQPLVIYQVQMGDIQAKAYKKVEPKEAGATATEKTPKKKAASVGGASAAGAASTDKEVANENAFYIKSLQASSFVFPDGSFGGQVEGGSTNEIELAGVSAEGEEEGISKYVMQQPKKPGFYAFKTDSRSNADFREWRHAGSARNFKDWLSGVGRPSGTQPWHNLQRLSGKFAKIIEIESQNIQNEGTAFVYSEAKNGGGAILLGLCFELFGFKRFEPMGLEFMMSSSSKTATKEDEEEDEVEEGEEDENDDEAATRGIEKSKGKGGGICEERGKGGSSSEKMPIDKQLRYALLTPEIPQSQQKQILKIFNSPENVNGEYIKVIIGSKIARDGIDLFHCVRVHLLIPPWTSSGTIQAVARALRAVSHDVLFEQRKQRIIKSKIETERIQDENDPKMETIIKTAEDEARVTVNLLRHCSVSSSVISVDEIVYRLSVVKDYEVRKIMRLLKQSAIDCELNYNRNVLVPYLEQKSIVDMSQECDYSKCRYVCGGGNGGGSSGAVEKAKDYSTYDLIYYKEELSEARKRIIKILSEGSHHTFNDAINVKRLVELCSPLRPASVYKALHSLVNQKLRIQNSLKEKSYICITENGDVLLTPDLMVVSAPFFDGSTTKDIKDYVESRTFERKRPFRNATEEGAENFVLPENSSSLGTIYKIESGIIANAVPPSLHEQEKEFKKFLSRFKLSDLINFLLDEKFYSKYISLASILSPEDATSTTTFISQTSTQAELSDEYKNYVKYLKTFPLNTIVFLHTAIADEEKEIVGEYASRNTRAELTRIFIANEPENIWRFVHEGVETEMAFALRASKLSEEGDAFAKEAAATTKQLQQRETAALSSAFAKKRQPLTDKDVLFAKYDPASDMLRIVDKRLKTTSTSGRVCTTYSRNELIVYSLLLVPDADAVFVASNSGVASGKPLANKLKTEKPPEQRDANAFAESLKKDFGDEYYSQISKIESFATRAYVLGRLPRNYMCGFLKNAFDASGRLVVSK